MERFSEVINTIKETNPAVSFKVLTLGEKKEELLFAFVPKKTAKSIYVYKQGSGLQEQAEIHFNLTDVGCYVSSFRVNVNMQQKGIGRALFNLAAAYSDLKGVNCIWGMISPIDDIKGVSNNTTAGSLAEFKALVNIYSSLGNRIDQDYNGCCCFVTEFLSGHRIAKLNEEQTSFLQQIDYNEKKFGKSQ